ncbi:hypothetical protein, partial [Pseudomonas protegens]
MDVNVHQLNVLAAGVFLAFAANLPGGAQAAYQETGRPGDAASWRSAEYLQDWGLDRMQANQAYAAGLTGSGVKIGA